MKWMLLILLVSSLYFPGHSQNKDHQSWQSITKSGSGVLSVIYYTQPGLIYKDPKTNQLAGVCVDILHDFQKFLKMKYGKEVELNFVREEKVFSKFLETLKTTQNVLGVSNITITADRSQFLAFTPPYMGNPVILITHKDAPAISGLNDLVKLHGYSAEVVGGSTHESYIKLMKGDYLPELPILIANSGFAVLDDISENPKLFTVMDLTEFVYAIRNRLPLKKQSLKIVGEEEQLAFAMKKGSDWQPLWEEFLTEDYRKSLLYRKHVVDHLGSSFLAIAQ